MRWFLLCLATSLAAQTDISGSWTGALALPNASLRLRVNISAAGDGWKATLDSMDQGTMGLAVAETTFTPPKLTLKLPALGATYEGVLTANQFEGKFTQGGNVMPLTLKRGEAPAPPKRPQTPQPPFAYAREEVTFASKADGVKLAGTLTVPEGQGPHPALILVSGSGPQDRDETILGHKPFAVIADYLARRGVAVLRYDDRGIARSTGNFALATTKDFALDAEGALDFLLTRKELAPGRIGIGGHSEGGIIAPMVAARRKDVAFVLMLAGPGVKGDEVLYAQATAIMRASGANDEAIAANRKIQETLFGVMRSAANEKEILEQAREKLGDSPAMAREARRAANPWFREFIDLDPAPVLALVKCPVLVINGELDLQVIAAQNVPAVEAALKKGGNQRVTVKRLPKINHLLQTAEIGTLAESARIEETVAPVVLEAIGDWIESITKR